MKNNVSLEDRFLVVFNITYPNDLRKNINVLLNPPTNNFFIFKFSYDKDMLFLLIKLSLKTGQSLSSFPANTKHTLDIVT